MWVISLNLLILMECMDGRAQKHVEDSFKNLMLKKMALFVSPCVFQDIKIIKNKFNMNQVKMFFSLFLASDLLVTLAALCSLWLHLLVTLYLLFVASDCLLVILFLFVCGLQLCLFIIFNILGKSWTHQRLTWFKFTTAFDQAFNSVAAKFFFVIFGL